MKWPHTLDHSRDLSTRRSFLRCGALSAAGLSLADLVRWEASANDAARAAGKSVILLWMDGGASHFETFEPKMDAPAETRGEFGAIPTALPGVHFCEHLPRTARVTDRLAIVRSMTHQDGLHEGGIHWVQTGFGYPRQFDPVNMRHPRNPAAGAVVARQCGPVQPGAPAYVKVFKNAGYEHSYEEAVYLGHQFDPLEIGDNLRKTAFVEADPFLAKHLACPALTMRADVTADRLQNRRRLSSELDSLRSHVDRFGAGEQMDVFRQQAFELLSGKTVSEAFDLSREPQSLRERYGRHLWGQGTLLARRLVETGVRFVTVNMHGDPPLKSDQFAWDTHVEHFPAMKGFLLPVFDQLFSALIEDLWQRGLHERVLVVAVGEFGRSPRIFSDGRPGGPGRTHWPQAFSAVLAGGGIRGGQVIGSSTRDGGEVKDRPISPQDLWATVYSALGIDAETMFHDRANRPIPILPDAKPIAELL